MILAPLKVDLTLQIMKKYKDENVNERKREKTDREKGRRIEGCIFVSIPFIIGYFSEKRFTATISASILGLTFFLIIGRIVIKKSKNKNK